MGPNECECSMRCLAKLEGLLPVLNAILCSWKRMAKLRPVCPTYAFLGCVHTNRVKASPIQLSQTHQDAAGPLCLTYNGSRCGAYTPEESSRVQSRESC